MPRGNLHDEKSRSRSGSGERPQADRGPRQPRRNVDEEVVSLREGGKSYSAVASAVGFKRATDAHAAFVRCLASRPEPERAALSHREVSAPRPARAAHPQPGRGRGRGQVGAPPGCPSELRQKLA